MTVTVSDGVDSTGTSFTLTVALPPNTAPTISRLPDQTTGPGVPVGPLAFTVADAESPADSLVLLHASSDSVLLPAANIAFGGSGANRTLTLTPVAAKTGTATVTVTVSDGVDSASSEFLLEVKAAADPPRAGSRLHALSVRGIAGDGASTLIAGLIVAGPGLKEVAIRVVGPALGPLGVSDAVDDPLLRLFDGNGRMLRSNDDWGGDADIARVFTEVGLAPLPPASKDAALVAPLEPGSYTVHGISSGGRAGVALVEVYDAGLPSDPSRLTALSVRSRVGTGENVLIVGLVVTGDSSLQLVIRGLGPALARSNLTGFLADPQLALFNHFGQLLQANDNWESGAALTDTFAAVGLAPLPAGSLDAVLLPTLEPGTYTVQLSGADGTSGVGLIEVYAIATPGLASLPSH